jgi:hypothetical protein
MKEKVVKFGWEEKKKKILSINILHLLIKQFF